MEKKKSILLIAVIFVLCLFLYAIFQILWINLFSPGRLSEAHAEFDRTGDCSACHTRGKQLDYEKCLECHEEIKSELDKVYGLHGKASRQCLDCHSEHHGRDYDLSYLNIETFDHSTTGWALDGLHSVLKCEACHSKESYVLNRNQCTLCHKDAHLGQLGNECHLCHHATSFEVTDYKHRDSVKAPKGKHLDLPCDECHKAEQDKYPHGEGTAVKYVGIDFTCNRCHDDVHDGEYGRDCAKCHNQETFEK